MKIWTSHPIALDSPDHTHAWGAARDFTRCPAFVKACERLMKPRGPLRVLDLGCAGGGLVEDFLEAGHDAYGVDGAEAARREAWLRYPDRFFQADLGQHFHFSLDELSSPLFSLVTAFEVLEHLTVPEIGRLIQNVRQILAFRCLFIATISLVPDEVNGVQYHQTVRPADWWRGVIEGHGFELLDSGLLSEEEWPRKETTSLRVIARRLA